MSSTQCITFHNYTVRTLKHSNDLLTPFSAFFLLFTMRTIFNTTELYKFQLRAIQHQHLIHHVTSCVVIPLPIAYLITKCRYNTLHKSNSSVFYNTMLFASLYHNPTQIFHSPCHLKSKLSFCPSQHMYTFIFLHILMHICDEHVHHIIFHAKFGGGV